MVDFHGPEASATLYEAHEQRDIELSKSETQAVAEKLASLKKFFGEKINARYKIEIQFGKARSTWKPFHGAMSLYLSGTKLNGGGDEKLYMCPGENCLGIIMPIERFVEETAAHKAISRVPCPSCQILWPESSLIGELLFNLTAKNWAQAVLNMFARLEHNADIYLKYHPKDIRYQAALEMAKQSGGEMISKSRATRGLHIYPLKNIIKDTGAGAQLYDRFLAFINA